MTPCGTPGYSSYNALFFYRIPYSHKYDLHQALCSSMLSPQFNAGLPSIIPGHLVAPQATPDTIHHSFIESHMVINTTSGRSAFGTCLQKQGKSEGFDSCDQPSNLFKMDSNRRLFSLRDLEIWQMTWKNNRAPLLYYIKLCESFQTIGEFKLELQSRNAQFGS